jgi:iron only hydrogenase large subunit-like protein
MPETTYYHAHEIIRERCKGRLKCVRNCPTKAIRVHDNKVIFFNDLCIDCGGCINICPEDVFVPVIESMEDLKAFKFNIVLPSNILYIQFGVDSNAGIINQALKNIGFDEIADVARVCDEEGFALRHHLRTHPQVRPLISSFCPTIVRFVQVRYPNLLAHLTPLDVPREIAAREAKHYYAEKLGLRKREIGVIYITPCPAKIVSIKQPAEKGKSWIDAAIPIKDIYNLLLPEVIKIQQEGYKNDPEKFQYPKAWGVLGHFSQNVGSEKALSVAGIDHVRRIFDDIESSKLHNVDFVEALACMNGCIGGIFCVKDPYMARHNSIQMQEKYGRPGELDEKEILKKYRDGHYFKEKPLLPRTTRNSEIDIAQSIKQMKKKERIFVKLPQKDCSICGAPTCETFADDCARGEADITDCIFFKK